MKKSVALALLLSLATALPLAAKTAEEKAAAVAQAAIAVVERFSARTDEQALAAAYPGIEKTYRQFVKSFGTKHKLTPDFALIRARAAAAARDKKHTSGAWRTAMQLKRSDLNTQRLLALNIEAAHATAAVGDFQSAREYFAAARAYAFVRGDAASNTRLHMRIRELNVLGQAMSWRDLKDALGDLKVFAEAFPMWTLPRLEATLSEAELRLRFEPEATSKREALSVLKAEIELMRQGMSKRLPQVYLARVRALNYALQDNYDL